MADILISSLTTTSTLTASDDYLITDGVTNGTRKLSGYSPAFGGSVTDGIGNVRNIPQNAQTTAYSLLVTDNGKHVSITTGGVTVPSGVFSTGQVVSIYNNSTSSQTITQGGGTTVYLAGTSTTGNRTLAQRGVATVLCVGSNTFIIGGAGLS